VSLRASLAAAVTSPERGHLSPPYAVFARTMLLGLATENTRGLFVPGRREIAAVGLAVRFSYPACYGAEWERVRVSQGRGAPPLVASARSKRQKLG
jgi:hypothetical protein